MHRSKIVVVVPDICQKAKSFAISYMGKTKNSIESSRQT